MKLSLLLSFAVAAIVASCSTSTPDAAKNARNAGINAAGTAVLKDSSRILTSALVQGLLSAAQTDASGGKVNFLNAAAAGAWSQANSTTTSALITDAITAFSAGKAANTAAAAQTAATAALAAGKQPAEVANAIASTISTAAGAPPAK